MGRLIQQTLPALPTGYTNAATQSETRTYDPAGRLSTLTDNNGTVITCAYDPLADDLTGLTASNGDFAAFSYTADGYETESQRGHGTTTINTVTKSYYPANGWLETITDPAGAINFTYDNYGNKTEVTTPSASTYYAYDGDNRLSSVSHTSGGASVAAYYYDRAGNRQSVTLGNGITTNYYYDALNRVTDIVNTSGPSFHYALQADGKRIGATESGTLTSGTTAYQYDPAGRLLSEVGPSLNNSYSYDAVGNRLSKTISGTVTNYTYDANDRITNTGYTFDADGNQTTINGDLATYDFDNHLIQLGSNGSPAATFTYDADGNRLSAATSSTTEDFLVDDSTPLANVLEEYNGSGTLQAHYDYSDAVLSMQRSSTTSYYMPDGLGSTRALTGSSGTVTDAWSYDAFGNTTAHSGSTTNEFQYGGQQFDGSTADYYLRARYYDETTDRLVTNDPEAGTEGDPVSLHRYQYADDDPVDMSDPSGRKANWLYSSTGGQSPFYVNMGAWNKLEPTTPWVPPSCNLGINIHLAIMHQYDLGWLNSIAKTGAIWDYKDRPNGGPAVIPPDPTKSPVAFKAWNKKYGDWYRAYVDWGDFHLGIVGYACFPNDQVLYIGAGFADRDKTGKGSWHENKQWGRPYLLHPLQIGTGPNYGDDESGHELIKDGIQYYTNWWRPQNLQQVLIWQAGGIHGLYDYDSSMDVHEWDDTGPVNF